MKALDYECKDEAWVERMECELIRRAERRNYIAGWLLVIYWGWPLVGVPAWFLWKWL